MRFCRLCALYAAVAILLYCSRDYNPFADLSNARVHVLAWSFSDSASVPVYCTGTLKAVVAVSAEVDSFKVRAARNRLWQDTVVRKADPVKGGPYLFAVSFYDTGVQKVTMTTYRSNGDSTSQDFIARVVSPLHQPDVKAYFGSRFRLAAMQLSDKDKLYHWDFGQGRSVTASSDTLSAFFTAGQAKGKGALWVSDLSNRFATPADTFTYSFLDTSKPVIYYFNEDVKSDTIFCGDSTFVFRVQVTDNTDRPVDSCTVNEQSFDVVNSKTDVYTKVFRKMTGYTRQSGPLALRVYAMDNRQFRNEKVRTFWVFFDPSGEKSPDARVTFIVPQHDSVSYLIPDITVSGTAENYRGDTMVLRLRSNDSLYADSVVIYGKLGSWQWVVRLKTLKNVLRVAAFSKKNEFLAADTTIVLFDPNGRDTIKPMIYGITVGSGAVENNKIITKNGSEEVSVIAFDEGTRVAKVTVSDSAAQAGKGNYYEWQGTVKGLQHLAGGNAVRVRATDVAGNFRDTTVYVYKNSIPVLVRAPLPSVFCRDSTYAVTFSCLDPDNDTVSLLWSRKPAGLVAGGGTAFSWRPGDSAPVTDSLTFCLYDGFVRTADTTLYVATGNCAANTDSIRFTTAEKDFPRLLFAGADTLSVLLSAIGIPAGLSLKYSARLIDRNQPIIVNSSSPKLTWPPGESDIGNRLLMVTVGDGKQNFDTLYPMIRVVHQLVSPCTLSWTWTGDTTSKGQLYCSSPQKSDTLKFAIHDQDDSLAESYAVTISRNNVRSEEVLNQRHFSVIISPDSTAGFEVLSVAVGDKTSGDSATIIVWHRDPSGLGTVRRLYLNTTESGAGVASTITKFPLLVRLTGANFTANAFSDRGQDIRFRKPDGTPLPYEIEQWDAVSRAAAIWVLADTVYGNNSDQYIELYHADLPAVDSSNPNAVFDTANGFCGVWHLNEDPTDNNGPMKDRTVLGNNGTMFGRMNGTDRQEGIIGGALNFDGNDDYISFGDIQQTDGQSQLTVSVWIKPAALLDREWSGIIGKAAIQANQWTMMESGMGGPARIFVTARNAGGPQTQDGNTTDPLLTVDNWAFCTMVYDGTQTGNSRRLKLFFNGDSVGLSIRGTIPPQLPSTNAEVQIAWTPLSTKAFQGQIDDAVISRTARSSSWIRLCYMNQRPVDALVVFK